MDPNYKDRDKDDYYGDEIDLFDDEGNQIDEEPPIDDNDDDPPSGDPPEGEENEMRCVGSGPGWE